MKVIKLFLKLLLSACLVWLTPVPGYAQDCHPVLSVPAITQGSITDGSYFYGPVTLESSYEGDIPFVPSGKQAYYSLDEGNSWNPASSSDKALWHRINTAPDNQAKIITLYDSIGDKGFAVLWCSDNTFCQRYNLAGEPLGEQINLDLLMGEKIYQADFAALPDGGFVVVWSNAGLWGRCFTSSGIPARGKFLINIEAFSPIVNSNVLGRSVVSWKESTLAPCPPRPESPFPIFFECRKFAGPYFRIYDFQNNPLSTSILLTSDTSRYSLNMLNDGCSFFCFLSESNREIYGKKYNQFGLLIADYNFLRFDYFDILDYKLVILKNMNFVFVFRKYEPTTNKIEVYLQRFNENAVPIGQIVPVCNNATQNYELVGFDDNRFMILHQDGNSKQVLLEHYNPDGILQKETVIKDYSANSNETITSLAIQKINLNSVVIAIAGYDGAGYYQDICYYNGGKTLSTGSISPTQNIAVRFKLVDPATGNEYKSEVRNYIYANPDDGKAGSIDYEDHITRETTEWVDVHLPAGVYRSVQLYQRKASYADGAAGGFGDWESCGVQTTMTTAVPVSLADGYAYQFKYEVINMANFSYEYTSHHIVCCDTTAPQLESTGEKLEKDKLTFELDIWDRGSGIAAASIQHNANPAVSFSGSCVSVNLDNGSNRIVLTARDNAGNLTVRQLFRNHDRTETVIHISGLEEGREYGDQIVFSYFATRALQNPQVTLDGETISPTGSEYQLDLAGKPEGMHTVTVSGMDTNGNPAAQSVSFIVRHQLLTLALISPQARVYENKDISLNYWANEPLRMVRYKLNNGPDREDLNLTGLPDGDYALILTAESESGKTASATVNFTVKEAFPALTIQQPEMDKVYADKTITVVFDSNAQVSYSLGNLSGTIDSGSTLTLPEDGAYTLVMTARHPVSGNSVRKTISFAVDTQEPVVEILTPRTGVFGAADIPVDYTTNKILTNIRLYLDGNEVAALNNLIVGNHLFRFTAEDMAGRKIEQQVNFSTARLEILAPRDNERIVTADLHPSVNLQYDAEGPFQIITRKLDQGGEQLVTSPPGEIIPVKTSLGAHELSVTGHINEFKLRRKTRFLVQRKNIAVDQGSINYTYKQRTEPGRYDTAVSLQIANTGDLDVWEPIEIRFDHITSSGAVVSQWLEIPTLAAGKTAKLDVTPFNAAFGDVFSVTIDPDNRLEVEDKSDNHRALVFQTGQIIAVRAAFPDSNVYLQNVSFFNVFQAQTAGPIAYVEFRAGDKTFVDNSPENGFNSIVDMGLLSVKQNYVQILAYGENGIVLDSYIYHVRLKCLDEKFGGLIFPWGIFGAADPNRIIMSGLDTKSLLTVQTMTINNALQHPAAIIPVIKEQRVLYQLVMITAQDYSVSHLDLSRIPMVGGNYEIPQGKKYLVIVTFDPVNQTVTYTFPIDIEGDDGGQLDASYQTALKAIETTFNGVIGNINNEEWLIKFLAGPASLDINAWGNLFFIHLDLLQMIGGPKNILGAFYFGFIDTALLGQVYIHSQGISLHYRVFGEYIVTEPSPNQKMDIEYEIHIRAAMETTVCFGTPAAYGFAVGFAGLSLFRLPLPMAFVIGGVFVYPQHMEIPLHAAVNADLVQKGGILHTTPYHFQITKSISYSNRLCDGFMFSAGTAFFILPFISVTQMRGSLSLYGQLNIDRVAGIEDELLAINKPELLFYARGGARVKIETRSITIIFILWFPIPILRDWETVVDNSKHEEQGWSYPSNVVNQLINKKTIDTHAVNPLLFQ